MSYFSLFTLFFAGFGLEISWEQNLDELDIYRARVLAVAEDGVVALIDRDQRHIVFIDDMGQLLGRVTARGQGPGELANPVEIAYSPTDQSFAVLDFANARLSKWKKSGQFLVEHPMPRVFFRPGFSDADHVFLIRDPFGQNQNKPAIVVLNLKNNMQKIVWEATPKAALVFSRISNSDSADAIFWRWNPSLVYGIGSDFLAIAFGSEPTVHLIDFEGKVLAKPFGANLPQFSVSDTQIEDAFDLMPANMRSDLRAGLVKPSAWPVIRNILVDGKDRIWVVGGAADIDQPHLLQIYSKSGQILGSGKVEKMPLAASATAIYYLKGDEDLYLVKAIFTISS